MLPAVADKAAAELRVFREIFKAAAKLKTVINIAEDKPGFFMLHDFYQAAYPGDHGRDTQQKRLRRRKAEAFTCRRQNKNIKAGENFFRVHVLEKNHFI